MSHGFGILEALQEFLPDTVVVLFALLTQLGDTWFLFAVLVTLYLLADRTPLVGRGIHRRDAAFLLALGLGAVALTVGAKTLFGHPRPPGADVPAGIEVVPVELRGLYTWMATADGHSLPSGHAIGSTVVYGGLALVLNVGTRRRRLAAAAAVVVVVGVSRVVLGVHYPGDVLLGIATGLTFLAGAVGVAWGRPGRALLLAVGLGLLAVGLGGYDADALTVLGAAIGARITWGSVGGAIPDRPASDAEVRLLAGVGLPVAFGLFGLTYALGTWLPGEFVPPAAAFLAAGLTLGVLLSLPVAASDYAEGRLGWVTDRRGGRGNR